MPCEFLPPEYQAVRHILEDPMMNGRCSRYIKEDGFDWTALFTAARTMSSGGQLLIRIAYDLWTSNADVGLSEITRGLDSAAFARVLDALRMCRSTYPARRSQWLLREA